jgi:CheY-like chemotaxis protein
MPEVQVMPDMDAVVNGVEQASAGLSILVVEDDADAARSYEILLGLFGHRPRLASDGPTALRLAAESMPDVALIDLGLPGMDGYEVAKRLSQQSTGRRPLLIAVTGYGQEGDRLRSAAVGIDLHLVKPVDPDEIMDLLRRFERVIHQPQRGLERPFLV